MNLGLSVLDSQTDLSGSRFVSLVLGGDTIVWIHEADFGDTMIERPAGRLILLDPEDRLFMFNVHEPQVYDAASPAFDAFWIMTGGMVNSGEDYSDAAVREAHEETGLTIEGDVRWVWSRERRMNWRGRDVLHKERFFLARTTSTEIDLSGLDEKEQSMTKGYRWWRPEEIADSTDRFEPRDLAERLKALLQEGLPAEPIWLD